MMDNSFCRADIFDLLYRLGVTENYIGFFQIADAVSLCTEQPERLLQVTKRLYPEVAKQYNTNWKAVERNIRTVGCIIWRENRPLLEHLAFRRLERQPRNAQLLSILSTSLDQGLPSVCEPDETAAFTEESGHFQVYDATKGNLLGRDQHHRFVTDPLSLTKRQEMDDLV